jgi:kynurenine 3-monooxygenase
MEKNVTIIGAGLVGSLLSIYLAKRGYRVNIYERRPDMRNTTVEAGRSINLALSDRGWRGLEGVGIAEEIKKIAIPMYGRFIHHRDGSSAFQKYGKDDQAIFSVSRAEINMKLMDLAEEQPGVEIHFNKKCIHVDRRNLTAKFEGADAVDEVSSKPDLLFVYDGPFSATRLNIHLKTELYKYNKHNKELK